MYWCQDWFRKKLATGKKFYNEKSTSKKQIGDEQRRGHQPITNNKTKRLIKLAAEMNWVEIQLKNENKLAGN